MAVPVHDVTGDHGGKFVLTPLTRDRAGVEENLVYSLTLSMTLLIRTLHISVKSQMFFDHDRT